MNKKAPRFQLIVRYPNSREDSYILDFRQYRIGVSEDCDIRIMLPGVASSHLMLFVEQDGIYVVNLQSPETALLNENILSARSRIDVGDELLLSDSRLHLEYIAENSEDHSLSPDGLRDIENIAIRDIRQGWMGYSRLLELLSPFISPAEATQANKIFSRGMRALWLIVITVLVLSFFQISCQARGAFRTGAFLEDIALALAIIGSLVVVSTFHIGFAGRVILPLATCLIGFIEPPSVAWTAADETYTWSFFIILFIFFLLGWCIDYGAQHLPSTTIRRKRTQFLALVLVALLNGVLSWLIIYFDFTPGIPFFTYLACISCIFWKWWPGPWLCHKSATNSQDVLVFSRLASSRWARIVTGRLLALALICMPVFLFLGSLGLRERISWPKGENAVFSSDTNGVEYAWFWYNKGRYLTASDYKSNQVYYVLWNTFASTNECANFLTEASGQMAAIQDNPTNPIPYIGLQKLLDPYRIKETNPRILGEMLWRDDRTIFFLKEEIARPTYSEPKGYSIYHAQNNIGAKPLTRDAIERLAMSCNTAVWPVAVLAFWGAVILWRRGGDSSVGRWIGVWMVAQATGLLYSLAADYILPPTKYFLWHKSLTNPLATALHSWVSLFEGLSTTTIFLGILAQAVIWVNLCWPNSSANTPTQWNILKTIGKVLFLLLLTFLPGAIVGIISAQLWSFGNQDAIPLTNTITLAACQGATILFLFISGWLMRKKTRARTELPHIGFLSFMFVLFSIGAIHISTPILPAEFNPNNWFGLQWEMPMTLAPYASTLCIALTLLAGFFFLFMLIRGQFLKLVSQNDISIAFIAVALPFMFEAGENLVQAIFQDTMLLSSAGTQVLSVTVVVLVLAPAWRFLERFFKLISVRDLRRIEKDVESTLEKLIDTTDVSDIREDIAQALARMNVNGYAFYNRAIKERFDLQMSRNWPTDLPATLQVSESLRVFFGRRQSIVDFKQLAFDWTLFFFSFELKRFEKTTRCRYLLPICLGPSVRGILIVPEDARSCHQISQFVTESMNTVGLVALAGGNKAHLVTSDVNNGQ